MTSRGDAMKRTAVLTLLSLLLLLSAPACGEEPNPAKGPGAAGAPAGRPPPGPRIVRPAALAGTWYPGDPKELAAEVDGFLDAAPAWDGPAPIALVAPHAGHRFAGKAQGAVYRTVRGRRYRRVFLLGVNHRSPPVRGASIPDVTDYETPLGRVPLDRAACDRLKAWGPIFRTVPGAHRTEHSIEIHLPFLQRAIPDLVIVPMVVRIRPSEAEELADALAEELGPGDLVVASSDDCHYGPDHGYVPFPPDEHLLDNLKKLDMGLVDRLLRLDLRGFADYKQKTGITVCGFSPLCTLLALLPAKAKGRVVAYDTSARTTGETANVVTYVGVAFTGPDWKPRKRVARPLTAKEKAFALKLARASLTRYVKRREVFDPWDEGWEIPGGLKPRQGSFVTLKIGGRLRGCIGDIVPRRPLYRSIVMRAVDAAVHDSRFRPVREEELDRIRIEISALSPPRKVSSWKEIELGKHGILLYYDGRFRAVYLPQVAPEQGWTLEETLSHLSRKGGLPVDAWRSPRAGFRVFTAQVFGEDE